MTANAIIAGTFADLRSVKSRSVVVLHIEVPIERAADVVAMFGYPQPGEEVSVAVARLLPEAAPEPVSENRPETDAGFRAPANRRKWDELSLAQQAGIACGDTDFWRFLEERYDSVIRGDAKACAEIAASDVREVCEVKSRAEFDRDEAAASRWNALHGDFRKWRADRVGQEQAEAQAREYGRT